MVESVFRGVLSFFFELGIYDVVLPFLLIFSIVFAIFEKTRVFGVDKYPDGKEYPKKNINSMVAFVIAFFVVASSQLVQSITKISANMVILLLGTTLFLLLAGSFHKETEEGFFLEGTWKNVFMFIVFGGLVLIFLDAIKTGEQTWLQYILDQVQNVWDDTAVASIILIIAVIGIMLYVTSGADRPKAETDKK